MPPSTGTPSSCPTVRVETPKPQSALEGPRLVVVDNGRPGARRAAELALARLTFEHAFSHLRFLRKRDPRAPAPAEFLDEVAAHADIVLTGTVDCESTTGSCIHDLVELERRGVPTALLVAAPFEAEALSRSRSAGLAAPRLAIFDPPPAELPEEEVLLRADALYRAMLVALSLDVNQSIRA